MALFTPLEILSYRLWGPWRWWWRREEICPDIDQTRSSAGGCHQPGIQDINLGGHAKGKLASSSGGVCPSSVAGSKLYNWIKNPQGPHIRIKEQRNTLVSSPRENIFCHVYSNFHIMHMIQLIFSHSKISIKGEIVVKLKKNTNTINICRIGIQCTVFLGEWCLALH